MITPGKQMSITGAPCFNRIYFALVPSYNERLCFVRKWGNEIDNWLYRVTFHNLSIHQKLWKIEKIKTKRNYLVLIFGKKSSGNHGKLALFQNHSRPILAFHTAEILRFTAPLRPPAAKLANERKSSIF